MTSRIGSAAAPLPSGPSASAVLPQQARPTFRPEIEGLRFFAVFLVVIYHIWLGRVSGGVDIFLLVSAFLMTSQFTRRIERNERINLGKHWLHLVKRLLPIAVVVIAVTALLSWLIIPGTRWLSIIAEGWASLFYFENWALAANSVNYYASHAAASPYQHFWSLSIQGQVFVLWPILFALIAWARRRWNWSHRALMIGVFSVIFVVSLAFSVWETNNKQAFAYFDLRTRLWEFALGSLLALLLPYLALPRLLRVLFGWVGLIGIVSCGLVLQVDQQFPGYLALWPTVSAGLVIVAGASGSRWGVDRLLSARPLVFMGGNSYGLYLWHWPILVLYLIWKDQDAVSWYMGLVLIAGSILLAILSTRFIERPARKIPWVEAAWYRSVPVVVAAVIVAAAPLLVWQGVVRAEIDRAAQNSSDDNPGAVALLPGFTFQGDPSAPRLPLPADLPEQFASLPDPCTGDWATTDVRMHCSEYTPEGTITRTVLVIGDSHAEQWLPALQYAANAQGWRIVALLLGGCPYTYSTPGLKTDCNISNGLSTDYAMAHKPEAVFMVGTAAVPSSPQETIQAGFEKTVTDLTSQGIQVVAIRDNPRFSFDMAECVISKGAGNPACNPLRSDLLAEPSPFVSFGPMPPDVFFVDMTDLICTDTTCPGVVGNLVVYIDNNHLTKAYSATMGPTLEQRMLEATGWGTTS
ncbi:acyltransferase family protein [Psychromicrobium xiongbiense]|uniref:acyltransferase family protein n=1 Tax=Psychromicrobium xiongbiense TaxID=3051184 RepID=UPI0025563BB2|nr:acyltransferase family protein [Psychromicrobium sp. YIM S02556]